METKYSVLYLEDNAIDADLLVNHFSEFAPEFKIEIAQSGKDFLDKIHKYSYDLFLLDNKLPDIDGIDVLKLIISKQFNIPAIMITGSGDEKLVIDVLRIGASSYISKTGDYLDKLPNMMKIIIQDFNNNLKIRSRFRNKIYNILYIEKSDIDIDLTKNHFSQNAKTLNLIPMRNPLEALSSLEKGEVYDLVLADLRMPEMSALEFLKELKYKNIEIPVIVITGKGDEEHAVASIHLGAYDYIVKRDDYLLKLPYVIYNAIDRFHYDQENQKLMKDLKAPTQELEQKNKELEEINNTFVGREFRIQELKEKIKKLEQKLK